MKNLKTTIKQLIRLNELKVNRIKKNIKIVEKIFYHKRRGRLIFFLYELTHYQSLHLIHLAGILSAAGFEVFVAHCSDTSNICELKNHENNNVSVCNSCKLTNRKLLSALNIKSIKLIHRNSNNNKNINSNNDAIIRATATRYYLGDEKAAIEDEKVCMDIKNNFENVSNFASDIDVTYEPDLVISNMTDYSYYFPIFDYFSKSNRFLQVSATSLNHQNIIFDKFKLFPALRAFNEYIESTPKLSDYQRADLQNFMEQRLTGKHTVLKRYKFHENELREIKDKLNYNADRRNIFVFPNLHWDAGVSTKNSLFSDVLDWIGTTFDLVRGMDNVHLYLKPHPEENFSKHTGKKGIIESVLDRGYSLPDNISIIDNKLGIKPIDLFSLIDLGIVSSGTLGLEMLYGKVPTINVGVAAYSGTQLDSQISSISEYTRLLKGEVAPKEHSQELVESFLHFYFLSTQVKWPLGNKFNYDERFSVNVLDELNIKEVGNLVDYFTRRSQDVQRYN